MQDFECFLQNYGYENKEVQTFLIKNNKHYLFQVRDLLDILLLWNIFYQI